MLAVNNDYVKNDNGEIQFKIDSIMYTFNPYDRTR